MLFHMKKVLQMSCVVLDVSCIMYVTVVKIVS